MSEHVQFNQKLIDFLDASVSKYHAVSEITKLLTQNGFMRLEERDSRSLEKGGKYFVVRNNSSIIGFVNGEISPQETGLSIVGAHTDSPSLMLKPNPIIRNSGYIQLGVEVYGGALLKPWFDRDLSISGRIFVRDKTGELSERLVDFENPIGFIPSLAIHLNRDANGNSPINAQTDILPILSQENLSDDLTGSPLEELLKSQFMDPEDSLLAHDLYLYDTQPASVIGLSNEFIASRCLDNLVSCYAGIEALLGSSHGKLSMVVLNDHEEVGSLSTTGADGPFLESIIRRLCKSWIDCDEEVVKARSMVLSCDNAHAVHPNFSDKHDPNHRPLLNRGIVIKYNAKQRYATDGFSAAFFKDLCEEDIAVQSFVSRNDMPCGSTIGPLTAGKIGVRAIDIGISQLAMHSCREIIGARDPLYLYKALGKFFSIEQ